MYVSLENYATIPITCISFCNSNGMILTIIEDLVNITLITLSSYEVTQCRLVTKTKLFVLFNNFTETCISEMLISF